MCIVIDDFQNNFCLSDHSIYMSVDLKISIAVHIGKTLT